MPTTAASRGSTEVGVSARAGGFTLIELTVALAIIAGSMMTLLLLRTDAADRLIRYSNMREIQQLAARKLDEVIFGFEDALEGDFEEEGDTTGVLWSVELLPIGQEEIPLLECSMTITYPISRDETEDYILTTWFYPDEESPLLAAAGIVVDDEEEN